MSNSSEWCLSFKFCNQKTAYIFLFASMWATFPAHHFLLDAIILIVSGGAAPVTSTLFGLNILLGIRFSNIPGRCTNKVSRPIKIRAEVLFVHFVSTCFHIGDGRWRAISRLELTDVRDVGKNRSFLVSFVGTARDGKQYITNVIANQFSWYSVNYFTKK